MQLPTLDHPGWGHLLAVVAGEQGPQPGQRRSERVGAAGTSGAQEHDAHDHGASARSDAYA